MNYYVGIDGATSTGIVMLDQNGGPVFGWQGDWLAVRKWLEGTTRPDNVVVGFEVPFVGENKRGAVQHAIKVGVVLEAVSHWSGWPVERSLEWEPKAWRRLIGAPMGGKDSKRWCSERAQELGLPVRGPRGGWLEDMGEAWGIAEATRKAHYAAIK